MQKAFMMGVRNIRLGDFKIDGKAETEGQKDEEEGKRMRPTTRRKGRG